MLPPGLVLHAKKRRKVATIIQHMMVRILQEREPLVVARIREELKQQTPRVDPGGLPARPASCRFRGSASQGNPHPHP